MPKLVPENIEKLQFSVHSLMPGTEGSGDFNILLSLYVNSPKAAWVSVRPIGDDPLIAHQTLLQPQPKNADIRVGTGRKRAVDPDDVFGSRYAYLIA